MSAREEVLFSTEERKTPEEIGDFLIRVGSKLKEQGFFVVTQGDRQIEVRPRGNTKLELKYEIEDDTEHQFEMEIEWNPDGHEGGPIEVS